MLIRLAILLVAVTANAQVGHKLVGALANVIVGPVTNTTYFVVTCVDNPGGESDYSPMLTYVSTNNTVTLAWDVVPGADYYRLYWGTNHTNSFQWSVALPNTTLQVFVRPTPLTTNYQKFYEQDKVNLGDPWTTFNPAFRTYTNTTGGLTPGQASQNPPKNFTRIMIVQTNAP